MIIGILRNAMGTGTLLAFLADDWCFCGWFRLPLQSQHVPRALGEVIGTGVIGSVVSALIVAPC
jgi:energy coupling factor transporter S component ThiW